MNNNSKIHLQISGIDKVLKNLQNKHPNARYNHLPFEKTNLLAFCVEHSKKKKSVFTSLDNSPDANFGVNSVNYVLIDKNDRLQFGTLDHRKIIMDINELYTKVDSYTIYQIKREKYRKSKSLCALSQKQTDDATGKTNLDIELDFEVEKGSSIIVFINFYHFLDKESDQTDNVNLKLTCYMARFNNIQTDAPLSFLQKISKKQTKYFTHPSSVSVKN